MPPREIGMPESEVLEPAEMEFVSGQLPRPQKDARDPHQLVAWRDDKGVLAAYRRRREEFGSFERPKPACPDLCWSLGSRLVGAPRLLRPAN
jgi:hypothetical protein